MRLEIIIGYFRCLVMRIKFRKFKQIQFLRLSYLPRSVEFEISTNCKSVSLNNSYGYRSNTAIRVRDNAELSIGSGTTLNSGSIITCREKINIGNNVLIGPNVMIFDNDHDYKSKNLFHNFITRPIVIGDNVWIGANALILKGTTIGENSVIGGGAIVRGNVPENCLYVNEHKSILTPFEKTM